MKIFNLPVCHNGPVNSMYLWTKQIVHYYQEFKPPYFASFILLFFKVFSKHLYFYGPRIGKIFNYSLIVTQ